MKIHRTFRRHATRNAVSGLAALAAVALLLGCSTGGPGRDSPEAARTELTVGLGQLAPSVDIHVDSASTSRAALTHVYDRLAEPDYAGGWLPSVATEWAFNEDVTELIFTLRDDVVFSDGTPLTADDVKYSMDRILDPENKAYALGPIGAKFSGAEVIDEHTVALLVKDNDVTGFSSLAQFYIVPRAHAEANGMGMAGEALGSGPMMVESFTPNDHMTLVPNPNYWGDNPVTQLTKVTFLSIEDESARTTALESGRADVVFPMSPDIWAGLAQSQHAEPYSALMGQFQNLFLGKYDQDTPLQDQRVREAVNLAIDKQTLVESILMGTTKVASQMVPEGSPFYNDALNPSPYDPDRARELLTEAGYPDGFSIEMESTIGRTPGDRDIAAAIVQMLAEVGITVNWTPLPATEWLTKFVQGTGAPLFMLNTSIEPSNMPEGQLFQWTGTGFTKVMSDPSYDEKVAQMASTVDDETRIALVKELNAELQTLLPVSTLYQIPMLYGVNRDVSGFEGRADMSFRLDTIRIG